MELQKIVFDKIKKLTNKNFDLKTKIEDLNIDSLDLVELIVEAEDELNIRIEDELLTSIETVSDILKAIKESQNNK